MNDSEQNIRKAYYSWLSQRGQKQTYRTETYCSLNSDCEHHLNLIFKMRSEIWNDSRLRTDDDWLIIVDTIKSRKRRLELRLVLRRSSSPNNKLQQRIPKSPFLLQQLITQLLSCSQNKSAQASSQLSYAYCIAPCSNSKFVNKQNIAPRARAPTRRRISPSQYPIQSQLLDTQKLTSLPAFHKPNEPLQVHSRNGFHPRFTGDHSCQG